MSRYQPYPEYKDSGVEWIGEVPGHWGDVKLLRVFYEKNKDISSHHPPGAISFGEVVTKEMRNEETLASYQALEAGEFIVNPLNLNYDLKSLRVALADKDVRVSSGYIILGLRDGYQPRYIRWLMHLFDIRYMKTLGGGIRQTITFTDIAKCHSAMPGFVEQNQIATFLDRETTRLDTLIEKKERFIELLQEKRQAIITQAVTKGLDPNVPMKDSGVEWIGEVPAHWVFAKIKHIASFYGGGTPEKDNTKYWNGDIPWVSPKDMKCEFITDSADHITQEALDNSSTRWIDAGAVLVVSRSGILRHEIPVGINKVPVSLNQDMKAIVVNENKVKEDFMLRWIQGLNSALRDVWSKEGTTVESLEYEYIASSLLSLPSLEEQNEILSMLDHQTARLDALAEKTRQSIDLLKERRSSLITAAVTGKIDVRGEAA